MAKKDNDKTPKKYNLRKRKKKNYKLNEDSDSDSDDSDWSPGMEDEDEIERALEFQKFLQKMFPSKNQNDKVNQLKNIKKMLKETETKSKKKKNLMKGLKIKR